MLNTYRLRLIPLSVSLLLLLCLSASDRLNYLGPNRTYTVQVAYSSCVWQNSSGEFACSDSADPDGYGRCEEGRDHKAAGEEEVCGVSYYTETHTDPSATAALTPQCPDKGSAGWCKAPMSVSIHGHEPVNGYGILAIEGRLNGEDFSLA